MMFKLYYAPETRAFRVRWMLEELKAEYQIVMLDLSKREHKSPHYRKIHPLGKVPALVDGPLAVFESSAICLHLADTFPSRGFAPRPGSVERAFYLQWIFYAAQTLEPMIEPIYLRGFRHAPDRRKTVASQDERKRLSSLLRPVSKVIDENLFLLEDGFSTADVVMGGVLDWADRVGLLKDETLETYLRRLKQRSAWARAGT